MVMQGQECEDVRSALRFFVAKFRQDAPKTKAAMLALDKRLFKAMKEMKKEE
jgi:hypothetical protein